MTTPPYIQVNAKVNEYQANDPFVEAKWPAREPPEAAVFSFLVTTTEGQYVVSGLKYEMVKRALNPKACKEEGYFAGIDWEDSGRITDDKKICGNKANSARLRVRWHDGEGGYKPSGRVFVNLTTLAVTTDNSKLKGDFDATRLAAHWHLAEEYPQLQRTVVKQNGPWALLEEDPIEEHVQNDGDEAGWEALKAVQKKRSEGGRPKKRPEPGPAVRTLPPIVDDPPNSEHIEVVEDTPFGQRTMRGHVKAVAAFHREIHDASMTVHKSPAAAMPMEDRDRVYLDYVSTQGRTILEIAREWSNVPLPEHPDQREPFLARVRRTKPGKNELLVDATGRKFMVYSMDRAPVGDPDGKPVTHYSLKEVEAK